MLTKVNTRTLAGRSILEDVNASINEIKELKQYLIASLTELNIKEGVQYEASKQQ